MQSLSIPPYEVKAGDKILGLPGFVVAETHYKASAMLNGEQVSSDIVYGAAGAWIISFTNGRELSYGATRKVSVLRGEDA